MLQQSTVLKSAAMRPRIRNILSEISLPVRCSPLELALLVPVIVNLPFFLFLI